MGDEPEAGAGTEPGGQGVPASGSASVVIASFKTKRDAERTVASLGRGFRHQARTGAAAAYVITRDPSGGFTVVQSRVVTASGVAANASYFAAEIMVGLFGIGAARKGAKAARQRAHQRQSGVGREADRLAAIFDQLGPRGACVLFHCNDEQTAQAVAKRADERGERSSHYPRTDFLASLDKLGSDYDWVRPAVAEPTPSARKHRRSGHKPASSG